MTDNLSLWNISGWVFGTILFAIGVAHAVLVHPVPGIVFILASLIYFPPVNAYLKTKLDITIPMVLKIIIWIALVWFTLGVSDLGDMIDDL